jgi:uncharacterized DUF497 family protein
LRFDWDHRKSGANRVKHGFGFEEVVVLFEPDVVCLVIYDESHSDDEDRFITIGPIAKGLVVVTHTEPSEDLTRIISARPATRRETELFQAYCDGQRR